MAAAGSGVRLGGGTPKALRLLAGRSLVAHAAARLLAGGADRLVVVGAADQQGALAAALADPGPVPGSGPVPAGSWRVVPGGVDRQESVRRGLATLAAAPDLRGCAVVLVHDAARPLVPPEVVAGVIAAVRGGAVAVTPAVAVVDTLRSVTGAGTVDRERLRAVQTPQGFAPAVLTAAHERAAAQGTTATDDVTLCERAGHPVTVVPGSRRALKITEPDDLLLAEALLRQPAPTAQTVPTARRATS